MDQPDLFGHNARKQYEFVVFHDESEPVPNRGWLLIGLLFVNKKSQPKVEKELRFHRQQENFFREIHFSELPKTFGGKFGAKARVARRWMEAYQNGLCEDARFTCLAVNRSSPVFNHKRFTFNYHAYNRFTAMAVKAGVSYLLQPLDCDEISLSIISDGKDRRSRPDQRFAGTSDNFEEYIPYRVELDSWLAQQRGVRYPTVSVQDLQVISSEKSDLLQFTDLLLGATQEALMGLSKRPVKQELGRMVVRWYGDLRKPPWEQYYNMHRKFDVWGFPDKGGRPFNELRLELSAFAGQESLF